MLKLPDDFYFGCAASGPQTEGAADRDGKGPSIWDHYAAPGKTYEGHTPARGSGFYDLYAQDFALMKELGIKHFRLSIQWTRIIPEGTGSVNQAGLDFYHRVFDSMLENGITPWVNLYHFDLPYALEQKGGWPNRDAVVEPFRIFADTVAKAYKNKVSHWVTHNEPHCLLHAYKTGRHAPFKQLGMKAFYDAHHHALVAHGLTVQAIKEHIPHAEVGLVLNSNLYAPLTETEPDISAARQMFRQENAHELDPLLRGEYPDSFLDRIGMDAPTVLEGDMEIISTPTDYTGLNVYSGAYVRMGLDSQPEVLRYSDDYPKADVFWLYLNPSLMYWGLRYLYEDYKPEVIHLSECGCGYPTHFTDNGEAHDLQRIHFLKTYMSELVRAINEGIPVKNFFLWTFADNYEWAEGYVKRFGIVHVDRECLKRTPKLSARWFSECIKHNAIL